MANDLEEKYKKEIVSTLVTAAEEVQKTLGDKFLRLYGRFRTAYMNSKGQVLLCDWHHVDKGRSYNDVAVLTTNDFIEQCVQNPYIFLCCLKEKRTTTLTRISIDECVGTEDLEELLETTDVTDNKTTRLKAWG